MRGTFRFYENGRLVGEQQNLITAAGKRAILSFLAGWQGNFASAIAVGSGQTAANTTDTGLELEWSRTPIIVISPDFINTTLVYKARLETMESGKIYEAGVVSDVAADANYRSRMITGFDSTIENWNAGAFTTSNARIGTEALRVTAATGVSTLARNLDTPIDLSGYSNIDKFAFAYNNGNISASNVLVRFYTDDSNYFTRTIAAPGAAGYKIEKFSKSDFVATGSPNWGNITSTAVGVTGSGGTATIDFDMIRIDDKDTYVDNNVLVTRTVLGSPITKSPGLPLDIEYTLDITI